MNWTFSASGRSMFGRPRPGAAVVAAAAALVAGGLVRRRTNALQSKERRGGDAAHRRANVLQPEERRGGDDVCDVLVIGGGVVGLSVARECAVRGARVTLVEREDDWAAAASSGNSGIGCTGYDAPVGSLERRLLRRSVQRHPELMRSFGLSHEHVRKCGSLVVAWTAEQLAQVLS